MPSETAIAPAAVADSQLPELHAQDVVTMVSEPDFKASPQEEQSQLLDHALASVYQNDVADSEDPEAHKAFGELANNARAKVEPGFFEKTARGTLDAVKGLPRMMANTGLAIGTQNPALRVAGLTDDTAIRAAGAQTRNYGEAAGQFARHHLTSYGRQLDKSIDELKDQIDNGRHADIKATTDKVSQRLAAYHENSDYAKSHGLSAPENAALLGQYTATRNPKYFDQLRANLLTTRGKAEVNQRLEEMSKTPLGKAIVEGAEPLNIAAMIVPALRGIKAIKAATGATRAIAGAKTVGVGALFGTSAELSKNPSAHFSEIAQSALNMAIVAGGMHAAPVLLDRAFNVKRGTSSTLTEDANLPTKSVSGVPEQSATGAANLSSVPSEIHSEMAQNPPINGSGPTTSQRPELRQGVSQTGQAEAGAVPSVRGGSANAPSGLQQAAAGGVVLPEASSGIAPPASSTIESPQTVSTPIAGPKVSLTPEQIMELRNKPSAESPASGKGGYFNDPDMERHHAALAAEAQSMGKPIPDKLPAESEAAVRARAAAILQANPDAAAELVTSLLTEGPRALEPVELAILEPYQKNLRTTWDAARKAAETNPTDQAARDAFLKVDARMDDFLSMRFENNSQAGKNLRALRDKTRDDLLNDLPTTLFKAAAKKGSPLTPKEKASVTSGFDAVKDAEKAVTAAEAKAKTATPEHVQGVQTAIQTVKSKRKPTQNDRVSFAKKLAAALGRPETSAPPAKVRPIKPAAKRPTRPTEVRTAEDNYAAAKDRAVKAAEQAEREAIAAEDDTAARSREASAEHPDADTHTDDIIHPDDAQKAAETRQPEIDARIRMAGEQAAHEFDATNGDHPGAPEFTPFMDATGLLTAVHIVRTMARQARDLTHFSAKMVRKFGEWIKPHLSDLWEAAKRGFDAIKTRLTDAAQAARKTSQQGGTSGNPAISAADAQAGLYHFAQIAAQKGGKVGYADWHDAMQAETPDRQILKHEFAAAESAYNTAISEHIGTPEPAGTPEQVKTGAAEVSDKLVRQLVRAYVEAGETDPRALLAKVHADLSSINPDQTERQTAVAISGYGKVALPDARPLRKTERELKTLIRLQTALADAQAGEKPLKSGPQRDKASQRVRAAQQALSDYLKDHPELQPRDPAKQLASARTAIISRLTNQAEDLQAIIDGKEKSRHNRASVPDDPEIRTLRNRVAGLKKQVAEMQATDDAFQLKQDAEWAKGTLKRVQKQAAAIERENTLYRFGQKDIYEKAAKRERQIEDAAQQEIETANARLIIAKQKARENIFNIELAGRTNTQKVFGAIGQGLAFVRELLTTADLSAILRQGRYALSHPKLAAQSLPPMFDAIRSNERMVAIENAIANGPNFALSKRSKLAITDPNSLSPHAMEEAHQSKLARKIPILSHLQRAYSTYLNVLRAKMFDTLVADHKQITGGTITPEVASSIAAIVNRQTGRSSLGRLENAGPLLNTFLFAPKLLMSRLELLTGKGLLWDTSGRKYHLGGNKGTRGMIAKEYVKNAAAMAFIYALYTVFQSKDDKATELDPRSADFSKKRFGDIHMDPLSGIAQMATFIARMVTGETVRNGEVVPLRENARPLNAFRAHPLHDKPRYGSTDAMDTIVNFARSKASPPAGLALNIFSGRMFNKPFTWGAQAQELVTPMAAGDVFSISKAARSKTEATILSADALLGTGAMVYPDKRR